MYKSMLIKLQNSSLKTDKTNSIKKIKKQESEKKYYPNLDFLLLNNIKSHNNFLVLQAIT